MSYANTYGRSPAYYQMGQINPRSRVTQAPKVPFSGNSRIKSEKRHMQELNLAEIETQIAINESDSTRQLYTLKKSKPLYCYFDLSYRNSQGIDGDFYRFETDNVSKTSKYNAETSMVKYIRSGRLHFPALLADDASYDMSLLYLEFKSVYPGYSGGEVYQFRFVPDNDAQLAVSNKIAYKPVIEIIKFNVPIRISNFDLRIRDRAGAIILPDIKYRGTFDLTISPNVAINSAEHGLVTGMKITFPKCRNLLPRIYTIDVIDADNFSINILVSDFGVSLDGSSVIYLVDDYDFDYSVEVQNIYADDVNDVSYKK